MADPKSDPDAAALERVRRAACALPDVTDAAFSACIDPLGDSRVVFLGVPKGAERACAAARASITLRLVERHGFRILALDAPWVRLMDLDRYVRNRGVWGASRMVGAGIAGEPALRGARSFLQRLRAWNLRRHPDDRAELRGLDIFDPAGLVPPPGPAPPEAAAEASPEPEEVGSLAAAFAGAQAHGRIRAAFAQACEHGVDHLDAEQARRALRGAGRMARAAQLDRDALFARRQVEMFTTLVRLLDARGPGSRAVVWTDLAGAADPCGLSTEIAGVVSMGGLGHDAYGLKAVSVALLGSVDAAPGGLEPLSDVAAIAAPIAGAVRRLGNTGAFWSWRYDPELAQALDHLSAGGPLRLTGAFEAAAWLPDETSAPPAADGGDDAEAYPFLA